MSSTSTRSIDLIDYPSSKNENKNISFLPLHRTNELENLHLDSNEEKQSKPLTSSSSSIITKKILTKCITVIGDETEK